MIALQLFRESYIGFSWSTFIDVRLEQPVKGAFPILVTFLGMTMVVKLVQRKKAQRSILVTLSGIVTEIREVQSEKT